MFLLTDYGTADEFAGMLRAVVARDAPDAALVDLTHHIPPFDVRAGALALERAVPHLGPGVVLAVVDPGVGTARRGVALEVPANGDDGGRPRPWALVGPDNGLLVWAAEALGGIDRAVTLFPSPHASATFDGRDLFAPAAAALCRGEPLGAVGEPLAAGELIRLPSPRLERASGRLESEVLWVDHFGNVQLAATPDDLEAAELGAADLGDSDGALELTVAGRTWVLRVVKAFGDLDAGALGILVDANGKLAIVCNQGAAATVLGVHAGETLALRRPGSAATGASDVAGQGAGTGGGAP